jgi:hypothetical protein
MPSLQHSQLLSQSQILRAKSRRSLSVAIMKMASQCSVLIMDSLPEAQKRRRTHIQVGSPYVHFARRQND